MIVPGLQNFKLSFQIFFKSRRESSGRRNRSSPKSRMLARAEPSRDGLRVGSRHRTIPNRLGRRKVSVEPGRRLSRRVQRDWRFRAPRRAGGHLIELFFLRQ